MDFRGLFLRPREPHASSSRRLRRGRGKTSLMQVRLSAMETSPPQPDTDSSCSSSSLSSAELDKSVSLSYCSTSLLHWEVEYEREAQAAETEQHSTHSLLRRSSSKVRFTEAGPSGAPVPVHNPVLEEDAYIGVLKPTLSILTSMRRRSTGSTPLASTAAASPSKVRQGVFASGTRYPPRTDGLGERRTSTISELLDSTMGDYGGDIFKLS